FPPGPVANFASLNASGSQDITAKSVLVTAQDGAVATISNQGSGDQTITTSGGGLDVRSSGGAPSGPGSSSAQINNFGAGSQTITVSGADGLKLMSAGGFASINNGPLSG